MLSVLHIENIAVIQSADISFADGFNVLTGETGAGKSIVIDAIGAVIGERTSRDLIRTGAKSARVTALFSCVPQLSWFEENGVGPDENGELVIERQILADGKNICRVGGRPVTVSQLKVLGQRLLNIHGQHDGQQLMDERCHLEYLDHFGAVDEAFAPYSEAYGRVVDLRREMERLQMDEGEKARRVDALNYQIRELERAELEAGEEEILLARRELLRNSEKLMGAIERAWMALGGGEDGDGAASLLGEGEYALSSVAAFSDELAQLSEDAAGVRAAAEDLAERVRDLRDSFDFSPGELDEIESRLDVLYRLKRKYGSTVEEMLDYLNWMRLSFLRKRPRDWRKT